MCRVDHDGAGRSVHRSQFFENPVEYAKSGPAHEPVVECLMRAVTIRSIAPHQPIANDVDDTADHTRIVNTRHALRFVRQQGLKPGELLACEPEVVVEHRKLPTFGSLNHISDQIVILFMGPEPRQFEV